MKYIDYKEHRTQGTFNFPVAYYHQTRHSPRYFMQHHWHTEFELIRIIDGSFSLILDNKSLLLNKGDIIFIPGGSLHGGTPEDCVYDCVVFDIKMLLRSNSNPKFIAELLDQKHTVNTLISHGGDPVSEAVAALCLALSERHAGYEFMAYGEFYRLFGLILEGKLYENVSTAPIAAEKLKSVKEVLSFISDNYFNNVSLDTLAHIAGMNPKYFCRYFKSVTGRTPIDYLNYYRVESACEMLSTRDISIKETAISCGFNDESYFIKTFHKYKGITPKQFMLTTF